MKDREFCKNCGHGIEVHEYVTRGVHGHCRSGHDKSRTCRCEVFMKRRRFYKRSKPK